MQTARYIMNQAYLLMNNCKQSVFSVVTEATEKQVEWWSENVGSHNIPEPTQPRMLQLNLFSKQMESKDTLN